MVRITVSGLPGSGTSTLVRGICEALGWYALNGGDVFREEAASRGLSVADFSQLCKSDPAVDRELDSRLVEAMEDVNGPEIVESRLAGWWAYRNHFDCLRIWVEVELDERLDRVTMREGDDVRRREESLLREEADRQRYTELYGIDILSMEPYDLVIDGTEPSATDVLQVVLTAMGDAS
ncbi:MAG: cytidylate kinase [Candidatus Poseidoniales archaeon]|nr:MAG: cytidylate kinase [Candidatus Poseidoniales archaeon]